MPAAGGACRGSIGTRMERTLQAPFPRCLYGARHTEFSLYSRWVNAMVPLRMHRALSRSTPCSLVTLGLLALLALGARNAQAQTLPQCSVSVGSFGATITLPATPIGGSYQCQFTAGLTDFGLPSNGSGLWVTLPGATGGAIRQLVLWRQWLHERRLCEQ